MKKLILILAIIASIITPFASEPTVKGIAVIASPTDKVIGTVAVWNGVAWISGTNGSGSGGSGDTSWTNLSGSIQAFPTYIGTDYGAVSVSAPTEVAGANILFQVNNNLTHPLFETRANGLSQFYPYSASHTPSQTQFKVDLSSETSAQVLFNLHDYTGGRDWQIMFENYLSGTNGHQTFRMGPGIDTDDLFFDPSGDYGLARYTLGTRGTASSGNIVEVKNNTTNKVTINHLGKITSADAIQTAAPNGGTAGAWKLGVKVDDTVVLDTAKYIQIDIGGTLYKVGLVQ